MAAVPLPEGRYLTLAWTIPDEIGGLTGAMLHRSRALVRLGGVAVDVLTFDNRVDYPDVEHRLRERGEIVEGVRLLNLWDWLREHEVRAKTTPTARAFTPLGVDAAYESAWRGGVELRRTRFAADARTALQTDYYRLDGSLLASDREDAHERGTRGGRSIVVCDRDGRPVRSWGTSWSLYRWWLDRLTAGEGRSFLIADSKPVSRFLRTYRRPGCVTVAVVHGSHLAGNIGPWGRLRPSRGDVLRHLDEYDSVVFLTDRQRRDARVMFGRHDNTCVIPNARVLPPPPDPDRQPGRGILLASLSGIKRPGHAVRAVLLARRFAPRVTLDVYGDGTRRRRLERIVVAARAGDAIRLHGYLPDARDRLAEASFLLMTSRSEGFGLVLLEAMGAGCIPIAYDIRYGPADVIDHRRTGFLVTSGNILGLARAIVRLQRMPDDEVERMRQAARQAAERYSDEAVLPMWASELVASQDRNAARSDTS